MGGSGRVCPGQALQNGVHKKQMTPTAKGVARGGLWFECVSPGTHAGSTIPQIICQ